MKFAPSTSGWLLGWKDFDIYFVLTWRPLNSPFYFPIPLYIFQIYGVLIKKVCYTQWPYH